MRRSSRPTFFFSLLIQLLIFLNYNSTGAIVGIAVGSLIFVVAVIASIVACCVCCVKAAAPAPQAVTMHSKAIISWRARWPYDSVTVGHTNPSFGQSCSKLEQYHN